MASKKKNPRSQPRSKWLRSFLSKKPAKNKRAR